MDILFIDAECPLCNRAALFLARRTGAEEIQFASLTGRTAREMGLLATMDGAVADVNGETNAEAQTNAGTETNAGMETDADVGGGTGTDREKGAGREAPKPSALLETVILLRGGQLYFRTEAVVKALSRARGFRFLRHLEWLPWRWLDPLYRLVAANRHRIPWMTRSRMKGNGVSESSAAPANSATTGSPITTSKSTATAAPAICYIEMPERMLP